MVLRAFEVVEESEGKLLCAPLTDVIEHMSSVESYKGSIERVLYDEWYNLKRELLDALTQYEKKVSEKNNKLSVPTQAKVDTTTKKFSDE